MRKNYILALLATGVLPLSAFGAIKIEIPNVSTDLDKWNISGISGVTDDIDIENGIVTLPGSQSGYPAYTVANLPAGKYKITGSLTNAQFVVVLGENEVAINEDGTFKTTADGNLVIEIKAVDKADKFSFGNINLVLDEDLSTIKARLEKLISDALEPASNVLIAPVPEMELYKTSEIDGADVNDKYKELVETGNALQEKIDAVNPAGANAEKQLEAYKKYENEDLEGQVKKYADAVNAYQNGVEVENEDGTSTYTKYPIWMLNGWAKQLQKNIADHDANLDEIKANSGWQKKLNDLVAGISEEHKVALNGKIEAAQQAIDDTLAEIAAKWDAEGVQEGKAEYSPLVPMTVVKDAYDALDDAHSAMISGEENYEKWLRKYQELTNAYINAQQVVKTLYNEEDEPGWKARQDSVMAGVTAIYNDAINGNKDKGIEKLDVQFGAGTCTDVEYSHDRDAIDAAIAKLKARTEEDTANLQNEKKALLDGNAKVDTLRTNLDKVWAAIEEYAYKYSDLEAKKDALYDDIEALRVKLNKVYASTEVLTDAYINDTTVDEDGNVGFGKQVAYVQADIDALKDQIAKANPLGFLTKALEDARTKISEDDNNKYLEEVKNEYGYDADVLGIMGGSFKSITDAIKQQQGIYDENYNKVLDSSLDNILTSIQGGDESYLANGINLAKAFADAFKVIIPAKDKAVELVKFIEKNQIKFNVTITTSLKGQDYFETTNNVVTTGYEEQAKDYQTLALSTIDTLLGARTQPSPQKAYTEVVTISQKTEVQTLEADVENEKIEYLEAVIGALSTAKSNNNLTQLRLAINNYLAEQIAVIDAGKYPGFDKVDTLFTEVKDAFESIENDYNSVVNASESVEPAEPQLLSDEAPEVTPEEPGTTPEEPVVVPVDEQLETLNATAKSLIEKLQNVQNEIDKVVKNQKAYDNLKALVNTIDGKEDGAIKYAADFALDPAIDTWKQLVEVKVAEANALLEENGEVYKAYQAIELLKALTLDQTNEDFYTDKLNEILNWFGKTDITIEDKDYTVGANFMAAVDANEKAHDILLDESASVTRLVDQVNTLLTKGGVDFEIEVDGKKANAADVFKGYVNELSDLDTDLYNTYKKVSCKGQDLNGTEEEPTLKDQYTALYDKITNLWVAIQDPFAQALQKYNTEFIQKNWDKYRNALLQEYHDALDGLKVYQDVVDGCQSLAENTDIQTAIDHRPIYDYADQIQKLLAKVTNLLETSWPNEIDGEKNEDQHRLTDDDLAGYIAQAEGIEVNLGNTYDGKVATITDKAYKILQIKKKALGSLIADAFNKLEAAECDPASMAVALSEARQAYENADLIQETILDGVSTPAYVGEIADAINAIDDVEITDAQLEKAAVSTFNTAADKVEKAIADAQKLLNESSIPSKGALQAAINAATEALSDCKLGEVTLNTLPVKLSDLKAINVAAIEAAINKAIQDNQANEDNLAKLNDKFADLNDNLKAFNNWVDELLVASELNWNLNAEVENVQLAINQAYIDEKLSDTTEVAQLEGYINTVQADIDQAYKDAYEAEYDRLQFVELEEAERAYNEAAKKYEAETGKTDYPETEGREYTAKINAQKEALETAYLVVGSVPTEPEQQAIVDIQTALLNIQIHLGYLSVDEVIAVLDEAAENAIEAIETSKNAIEGTYADELVPEYEALIAEVEAMKAEWYADDNEGAVAVVKEKVYIRDINNIVNVKLAALDAQAAKLNADGAAHEASNAAYERLNAKLDTVRQTYTAAENNFQTYADRLLKNQQNTVILNLTNADNAIVATQEALDLARDNFECEDFNLQEKIAPINSSINTANKTLWRAVTTSYQAEATQAIADAREELSKGAHTNADGFTAALNKLNNRLSKLDVVTNGNVEAGEKFVAEAEDIISNAEALFKAILDAAYTPGDITGTGEITTADYEALIDLLGQLEDSEDFDNPAYDVNGDGQVTMADIASIIDILMGRDTNAAVMARMPMINTNNAIYVVKTSTNNGISRYALILNNTAELFGAQMDIILSDGMEIVNEGVAERTSGNEFYGSTTYTGKHRIILSSINMNTFVGSEGAIVYIDVRGEGELNLDNVLGIDTAGRMYNINVMTNVTGIESISADGKNADIYNVAGQKMNRTQRGAINIIRTTDGKTSKIINK